MQSIFETIWTVEQYVDEWFRKSTYVDTKQTFKTSQA